MKTKEEIYLDEVKKVSEQLGKKMGKILLSDAIRKFTLNCLMKMEDQFRQPIVIKSVCDACNGEGSIGRDKLYLKCNKCHGTGKQTVL